MHTTTVLNTFTEMRHAPVRPDGRCRSCGPFPRGDLEIGKEAFYSFSLDKRKRFFPCKRTAGCGIDAF